MNLTCHRKCFQVSRIYILFRLYLQQLYLEFISKTFKHYMKKKLPRDAEEPNVAYPPV